MVRDSRKIAAILAADVVDYSRLMGADETGTLAALAARRSIFEAQVREFDGRVFGSVGDSLLAEFHSAVHAVECARAIQDAAPVHVQLGDRRIETGRPHRDHRETVTLRLSAAASWTVTVPRPRVTQPSAFHS